MSKKEKVKFVNELIRSIKVNIVKDLDKVPDHWDGVELRYLIREYFNSNSCVFGGFDSKKHPRYKDYRNECLVNNIGV